MNELSWAVEQSGLNAIYQKYDKYYEGNQTLDYVSRHTRNVFGNLFADFADNVCKVVVNVISSRIKLSNIDSSDEAINATINTITKRNKLNLKSKLVHNDAIKLGDSYIMVWQDSEGNVNITPQRTDTILVRYEDNGNGEEIVEAVKYWMQDKDTFRLTRYTKERIERYYSKTLKSIPKDLNKLEYYTLDGDAVIENKTGKIPIFHFSNSADCANFGQSEIKAIIPLQNALNKSVIDMLVAMEFVALPQRFATGIELETDDNGNQVNNFKASLDKLWATPNENAKFGQFDGTDLTQFLKIQDNFRQEICGLTSIPPHLLLKNSGDFPSGESLKVAESNLVAKVIDLQEAWQDVWIDIILYALELLGVGSNADINITWLNTQYKSAKEDTEVSLNKKLIGVSNSQILIELGYSQEQIEAMKLENEVVNNFNR